MDAQLDDAWSRLVTGDADGLDLDKLQRPLFYRCIDHAASPDPERRLDALRVASHFSADDRLRVVDPMITDGDARVRRYAFNLAVQAQTAGLMALRTCVSGPDPDLAVEALGMLITACDVTAALHARQWLRSEDPRIRAGAAMLLGNTAGPAMGLQLGRLAENDPVHGVRLIAAEAAKRCAGETPKATPRPFWEEGATPIELAPEPTPSPAAPPGPPVRRLVPPPPAPPRGSTLPTLYPEAEDAPAPAAPPPDAPAPADALVPRAEDDAEEVRESEPRDWRRPAPLPAQLPSQASALLKLIAMVSPADRDPVRDAFLACDERARTAALQAWRPGGDPVVGRGVAVMTSALGATRGAGTLRHMLGETDPGVRAGAAEAIGVIGALSVLPPLARLLDDPEPQVRVAAVHGLAALLTRTGRVSMLRERLQPYAEDADPDVRAAVDEALRVAS